MLGIKPGPSWVGREQGKCPDAVLQSSHFLTFPLFGALWGTIGDTRIKRSQCSIALALLFSLSLKQVVCGSSEWSTSKSLASMVMFPQTSQKVRQNQPLAG